MGSKFNYDWDLKGYDGLWLFEQVFKDFNTWKEKLNDYMFVNQIGDNTLDTKIFNILANMYKNNYFKWSNYGIIYNECALKMEQLYQSIGVSEALSKDLKTSLTNTSNSQVFNTDNQNVDEVDTFNKEYRVGGQTNNSLVGTEYIDSLMKSPTNVQLINKTIKEMRRLFMVATNEVRKEYYEK